MEKQNKVESILNDAAIEFLNRQLRLSNPRGKFDKAARWFPDPDERRDCCDSVRSPSRRFKFSLMLHCRTLKHVAKLYNVDEKQLRKLVKHL
jgi:hypothetical protein